MVIIRRDLARGTGSRKAQTNQRESRAQRMRMRTEFQRRRRGAPAEFAHVLPVLRQGCERSPQVSGHWGDTGSSTRGSGVGGE